MTWVEDATKSEDKQRLQRDVTGVDVSRKGSGRTCLMYVVIPRGITSTQQWSRLETSVSSQTTCRHVERIDCHGSLLRKSAVPAKFLLVLLNT